MRLVLDASIAIKLYVDEIDSPAALSWVERHTDFFAPDIFTVEVAQALLRHYREDRLDWSDLAAAVLELRAKVQVPFGSGELIERALQLAEVLQHRLHDCMYLALADRLQCPLLTADERLAGKAAAAKLSITVHLHTETPP